MPERHYQNAHQMYPAIIQSYMKKPVSFEMK